MANPPESLARRDLASLINSSREREPAWIKKLDELLRIPSISTLCQHQADVSRAAQWLANELQDLGFSVEILPTRLHPIVFASFQASQPGATALLVYGHYDVQPVEPLQEWSSPPFEPTIDGDFLYARGAMDMKGQIIAFLCALRTFQSHGGIPLNVKCIFEGEEEIGSPDLPAFLLQYKERLQCDAVLNLDGLIFKADVPSLVYGLRGLAYFELELTGLQHELHSGMFGGTFLNPAQAMCELLSGMHDNQGKITLPGFYEHVVPLKFEERKQLALLPFSDEEYQREAGASLLWGEPGYTTVERRGARPTLEIHGLISGYTGEGEKTIIPASAKAKLSCRLVPNQTSQEIHASLLSYVEQHCPAGFHFKLALRSGNPPALMQRDQWAMRVAGRTLEETFGKKPVVIREGGTVPVVARLKEILGYESIMLGCGVAEDNMHAPNERLRLPLFMKSIEVYIRFLDGISSRL
jgi:acetylornithine deacetylase/succinyl-diaminopimelate desuccinylase-like protein